MTRGGARAGAGRPAKDTVIYYRRVKPEWVEVLDNKLKELKMTYTVRFSERETSWVNIATLDTLEDAEAEYNNQLEEDNKNGWNNHRTEIIDSDGNIIKEYEGDNY